MEYHAQKEARVWSRVMGGESGCTCTGGLSAETLMTLIGKEQADACLFSALMRRVCPKERERLSCLAASSRSRMRQLGAVYFVLTGQKACPPRQPAPCITCAAESLRAAYKDVLARAEQYAALAKQGDFAHEFDCLSCGAREAAQTLLCVIAGTV